MSGVAERAPSVGSVLAYAVPLLVVAVLGAAHLPDPFYGDLALFIVGASVLDHGGALYVDFWDNKQPGIILFVRLAGHLFGYSECGIHALELVWNLVFSVVLIRTLRGYLSTPALASLVPIAIVGAHYAVARPLDLTRLELLVGFPLFACLWLSSLQLPSPRRRVTAWLLSGVCAGVAVVFKLVLAPIPVGFWLVAVWVGMRWEGEHLGAVIRHRLLPAAGGVGLVLGLVTLWAWSHGAVKELLWTSFAYPLGASTVVKHASPGKLVTSVLGYGAGMAPFIALACLSPLRWRGSAKEVVTLQLFSWIGTGLIMTVAQKFSWWQHHFILFTVPLGILAVRGADALSATAARWLRLQGPAAWKLCGVLIALALSPGLIRWTRAAAPLAHFALGRGRWEDHGYQRQVDRDYARIWEETRFLTEADAAPGPIYVFGNPVYYYLAGRGQALAVNGWSWPFFLPSQWERLPAQMAMAKPPYLFIDRRSDALVALRSPATEEWIAAVYRPFSMSKAGTWYLLR